jgi:uncharacterized protein
MKTEKVLPWVRVVILVVSLIAMGVISLLLTGSVLPENPREALIFQNALLLIVLGSSLIETHFTKPADSMVNALTGIITLITVYKVAPDAPWWLVFSYCFIVFLLATICTAVSSSRHIKGWRQKLAELTYKPAVFFGRARLLYSIIFLFGVFSFYELQSRETITLVVFWGIFIAIWPLGLPEAVSSFRSNKKYTKPVGQVNRTDWPNIVRIVIEPDTHWSQSSPKIYQQVDGSQSIMLPLFQEVQADQVIGTGLLIKPYDEHIENLQTGYIYEVENVSEKITESEVAKALGGGSTSKLIGFIVEGSKIGEIKFELWDTNACHEGMLVWCKIQNTPVFYQVTGGATEEEASQSDRRGFQTATAAQLGTLDETIGFVKYKWLPRMNTPVFSEPADFGSDIEITKEDDFIYGVLPGTKIKIGGPFAKFLDHHTALLGVTGAGKTELAFDMIRYSVDQGIKVICIDLTAKYEGKLQDVNPVNLTLSSETSRDLSEKLFEVETGKYGAGDEKKALKEFSDKLRVEVMESISNFMASDDENQKVAILDLEEISNTKATLYITELYLTSLLHLAKNNPETTPQVLIVVEEAHTVMPEPSTMGLGDYDSRGLVGKIAQIALQGRKYKVGLLVIAQRTATVSKTVLTQCNTVISFSCFDDTSLKFLSNIFGDTHVSLIPNLAPLNAVVFGKSLRSQRPIITEIPYDENKAKGDA